MIGWIHWVALAHAMPTELSVSLETDAEVVSFSQSQSSHFVAFLDSAGHLNP